jgi:hypothetical protein
MLARCTACRQTFRADAFGRQRCPHCGVEVELQEPALPATPAPQPPAPPPGLSPPSLSPEPAPAPTGHALYPEGRPPWERRDELGWPTAFFKTLHEVMLEPTRFFSSIRYDRTEGALLFFVLADLVPALVAALFSAVFSLTSSALGSGGEKAAEALDELSKMGSLDPHQLELLRKLLSLSDSPLGALSGVVSAPFVAFAMLYATAGISHLALTLFGAARGGWSATFKVFAYSYAAGLLALVPCCSGLLVYSWATVLQIIGLKHAHRTGTGIATAAVLSWHLAGCLVACGLVGLVAAPLFALAQAAQGN